MKAPWYQRTMPVLALLVGAPALLLWLNGVTWAAFLNAGYVTLVSWIIGGIIMLLCGVFASSLAALGERVAEHLRRRRQ